MNPISFCAQYRTDAIVQYKNTPLNASIVVLDKEDENDIEALLDLSELWDKQKENYVAQLLSEFVKDIDEKPDVKSEHCIALTTQKKDFDKLDPKKILGVSLFSEEDIENEINWFQVEPQNTYSFKPVSREYANAGYSLLDYLTNNFKGKTIYVNSANSAIGFYKKYGFKQYDKNFPNSLYYNA